MVGCGIWATHFIAMLAYEPGVPVAYGVGQTALRSPEEGIADLEAIKALGLRGVMLPGVPPNADYDDPMYDEFWDAVVDIGVPPSFHILTSGSDTPFAPRSNSLVPSSASSFWIETVNGGCAMCSFSAARRKFRVSARTTK